MKIEITPCELAELLRLIENPAPKTTTIELDAEKIAEKLAKVTENITNKNKADSVELDLDSHLKRDENWIKKQAEALKQFHH